MSTEFWTRKPAIHGERNIRFQGGAVLVFMDSNRRFSCLGTSWGHQDAVSNRGNLGVGCNFHRGHVQLRRDFYFVSEFCKEWFWSYFAHSRYPNINSTFRNYWCSSVSTYKMLSTEFGEKTELWLHTSSYKALYYSIRHGKSSFISPLWACTGCHGWAHPL